MSGLVPLSTIQDDFYVFDESRSNLVGRRTRRVIGLGDRLTVQVAKVDSFKKQVDFCLAAEEGKASPMRPPGSRPENSRRQDSRKTDSRPGKSQTARRSEERPQNPNKPAMFQTSGSKFST